MPRSVLLLVLVPTLAWAQPRLKPSTNFTYSAPRILYRGQTIRLEGTANTPARINSPQLSVVAPIIAFDLANGTISQVRAQNGVSLKLSRTAPAKDGGSAQRTIIESRSQSAVLTAGTTRTLELRGHLSGFYQQNDGPKSTLAGERALLSFGANNEVGADLEAPLVILPPENPNATGKARPDALGEIRISAQRGQIAQGASPQNSGTATFSGAARAVSSGGPSAFQLTADTFVVSRSPSGTLATLTTQGRTHFSYDLPLPKANSRAPVMAPSTKLGATQASTTQVGRPTHVEVASDSATFERGGQDASSSGTTKATFVGNVQGFYRLQSGQTTRDYPFSGTRAVITFDPTAAEGATGLNVEVTQASIDAPAFEF